MRTDLRSICDDKKDLIHRIVKGIRDEKQDRKDRIKRCRFDDDSGQRGVIFCVPCRKT